MCRRSQVNWHCDDEPLFTSEARDTLIISLSLGQARHFEAKLKAEREHRGVTRVELRHGDLLSMEGRCQRHYVHRIPKDYELYASKEPRVNLTWRYCHILC